VTLPDGGTFSFDGGTVGEDEAARGLFRAAGSAANDADLVGEWILDSVGDQRGGAAPVVADHLPARHRLAALRPVGSARGGAV
jgi:hypothetical protein